MWSAGDSILRSVECVLCSESVVVRERAVFLPQFCLICLLQPPDTRCKSGYPVRPRQGSDQSSRANLGVSPRFLRSSSSDLRRNILQPHLSLLYLSCSTSWQPGPSLPDWQFGPVLLVARSWLPDLLLRQPSRRRLLRPIMPVRPRPLDLRLERVGPPISASEMCPRKRKRLLVSPRPFCPARG